MDKYKLDKMENINGKNIMWKKICKKPGINKETLKKKS